MERNIFLDKGWQNTHLRKIREQAGSRYTPELNVDLPIAEIFDGISRTESFYTSIRKHYGKLNREFNRLSSKYENSEIQKTYNAFKHDISPLSKLLGSIKYYNTKDIPWIKINCLAKKASDIGWKLSENLRDEKAKVDKEKTEDKQGYQQSASERFGSAIHYLYEVQKELRHEDLSLNAKAKLSNVPFLLLSGEAGSGKTHLLCDVMKDRITRNKTLPSVLVFGELFTTNADPFVQIIHQLGLQLNKKQFLRQLNNAGKQSACRAIIGIDALNETRQRNFWKRNLNKVIDEVKRHPNVALVISVRSGFEVEVLTKKQKKVFVHEEHRGFVFREWEAVNKFFQEFHLPLPEIPLLMPEFQNPLFLLLFCKAFQERVKKNTGKRQKQIFRGHEGATYIFEAFVDSVSKRLSKQFGTSNVPGQNVWDAVIEKVAEEMVAQSDDRIPEDKVIAIVKDAFPSIDHAHFLKEMERNLLMVKIPSYSPEKNEYNGFDFRFPFQKFSDHLLGRYFFKKYEKEFGKQNKNLETAKKFFSRRRKLGKFLSKGWSRSVVEALSIQSPEHLKGCELVEVAPYLWDSHSAKESFTESLIWRKPEAFSADLKNTLTYINAEITKTQSGHDNLLNAFLTVAPIPNHPLNADFLHRHLSRQTMPKRDAWWSNFLHDQYGKRMAVDRLIEWGWVDHNKTHISEESIRLCSVALAWFLTTPNRFVRDKSTKALVSLLTGRLNVVLALLKHFKDVDDPYVTERLFAVAYGCALRSRTDKNDLQSLSEWVCENIFKNGNPPVHILLRDYARGIIEVASQEKLKLKIDMKKVKPPYGSQFPKKLPSNNLIMRYVFDYKSKDFQDYLWAQNQIINSMQPEYSEIFLYGDFGRYTFQSTLSNFQYPKRITMQQLSNWATKRVFDMGYDVNLHGKFDRCVNYNRPDRSEHKAERIGKKYQWIALHELLARVGDNFEFKEDSWSGKIGKYEGPWQLGIRDIDPSCILKEFPNTKPEKLPSFDGYERKKYYSAWNKRISDSAWLKKKRDLPDPKQIIEFTDDKGNAWLSLEGFVEWQEETAPEHEKYNLPTRTLWYMIKSYLIKRRDGDKVFNWAKQQLFTGRWMPDSREFYNVYLGEYPWASAFLYRNIPYYHHDGWTDGTGNKKIPAKILVTDDQYASRGSSIDCSTNEAINVKLPAKFILDEMELVQHYMDGRVFDKKGCLVALDPNVFDENMPRHVLMRKDSLDDFLKRKGYAIFWTLLGEKYMIGGEYSGRKWIGRLELSGAYGLNEKNQIVGVMNAAFKKP